VSSDYSDDYSDLSSFISDLPASKTHRQGATGDCATRPVDYIGFNKRQLKGYNHGKFIYPQKTYSEMFDKKKQLFVSCKSFSHKSGKFNIIYCLLIVFIDYVLRTKY